MQRFGVCLLLVLAGFNAQAAQPRAGLWNIEATIMADGAAKPVGPFYRQQCFSQEDIRSPDQVLTDIGAEDCNYGDKKYEGDRFTFTISCTGALPMSGTGSITYGTDTLEADANIVADLQGLPIATTSKISGKRVSDCAAK
jgi:hypothetical protein